MQERSVEEHLYECLKLGYDLLSEVDSRLKDCFLFLQHLLKIIGFTFWGKIIMILTMLHATVFMEHYWRHNKISIFFM